MNDGFTHIEAKDLSYSNSFPSPQTHFVIRWLENLTGRITILKLAKKHQAEPPLPGNFWQQAMTRMGINTDIGEEALAKIPKTGPLIVVANHPHGLVDGMVLCLADMPWVSATHINRLLEGFSADAVRVACFGDRRGHPVLFPREWFGALMQLTGDDIARCLFDNLADSVVEVPMVDDAVLRDVDHKEDLLRVSA